MGYVVVVIDVSVSNFEFSHPFVKEAFEKYGTRFEVHGCM